MKNMLKDLFLHFSRQYFYIEDTIMFMSFLKIMMERIEEQDIRIEKLERVGCDQTKDTAKFEEGK